MLIDKKHILLETGVEVRFQSQLPDYRIVVAVDVRVYTVHSLEDLTDESWEGFWKRNTYDCRQQSYRIASAITQDRPLTNLAGHDGFIVDVGLNPCHQLFNVGWCCHLGRPLIIFTVLPEIFKPDFVRFTSKSCSAWGVDFISYSSVAFISGHDCGEQNSVMAP